MPPVRVLQIDAFTDRPFSGNPAAVCLLEAPAEAGWMQSVAAEMNLAETAFVVRRNGDEFDLRWFTPEVEVDLCGHATLASAHALWSEERVSAEREIRFSTRSGWLVCRREWTQITMDFPAIEAKECPARAELLSALGAEAEWTGRSQWDDVVVVSDERMVRELTPDFRALRGLVERGVMVTARSAEPTADFVSRFFAPGVGIDEDPVTGSAHCCLGPYWAKRLGKDRLTGFQASRRGGFVEVNVRGDRVELGGQAVTVLKGELV